MNAKGRRQDRRTKEFVRVARTVEGIEARAEAAEQELAAARRRISVLETSHQAVVVQRDELQDAVEALAKERDRVDAELRAVLAERDEAAQHSVELQQRLDKLEVEEHDAGKLRRRLAERGRELDRVQAHAHNLEKELRDARGDQAQIVVPRGLRISR